MPWFREPHLIFSRIVGLSTTLWFCCKVGSWAKNLSRLGSLLLRLLKPGRLWRYPDYGHLLMVPLYPGNPPSAEATASAKRLVDEASVAQVDQSMQLLGEAILLNPPGVEVYLLRAQTSNRHGQHIAALDDAEMCVSIDAKCAEGWLEKGKAEMQLGRAIDAAHSFHQGLQVAPDHPDLKEGFAAARAEPSPNILQQFKDIIFAARLGLENLFRTLEDPQKTTDAFVESNAAVLDAQMALLAQTLHVNTAVLFESPRLCDAYEQIVRACSQLVAGAPSAFSRRLTHAESIIHGLCLALRTGWHIHHGIAKHAATALIMLSLCPSASEKLRRLAVKQLLGGLLRWLLDARPEPDREGEEVCGCNCPVPWKAAACFLERLLEPRCALVQQECEAWPDTVQLCQWLTLSVRDYHATPLGLVALLQLPGVAMKAMKSQAKVDFFIAPHLFGDEFGDLDESGDEKEESDHLQSPEDAIAAASSSEVPLWRAAQMSRQPLRAWGQQLRFIAAAGAAAEGTVPSEVQNLTQLDALRWLPDPPPPAAQRLGEWLMNSLGYLFLFIEGDGLFTVYACQALQTLAKADPEEDGRSRLLHGLWLGMPLLSKLSLAACTNTAALDLLHCLLEAQDPAARQGIRCAVRSLAYALANDTKDEAALEPTTAAPAGASAGAGAAAPSAEPSGHPLLEMAPDMPELEGMANNLLMLHEDDLVPSWAEFHQELFQELACPGADGSPDLVTLANFETKANLLAEQAAVHAVEAKTDERHPVKQYSCAAIPAAWNRNMLSTGNEGMSEDDPDSPWQTVSSCRLPIFYEDNALVGSDEYVSDQRKRGKAVLMSRRSIRSSSKVHNWAQAVSSAEAAGASAVVVFNDLDAQEPFRMGLFGEKLPNIPAFMVSGKDGMALCGAKDCHMLIVRSVLTSTEATPPWPLAGGRMADIAQAWSLLEALQADELDELLQRMSVPEKRVWLTRRLVRHYRAQQAEPATGTLSEPPLAFVEGDRWLTPQKQLEALRTQYCEGTGIGSDDICGEFEVRFRGEQGVGSAVVREWMDLIAREVYLHPHLRLLRSFDQRQTFWPDAASTFCNNCWKMDYEILGRLVGLALWQNCTLDLPLHPHICALLFGFPAESIKTTLADVEPELYRHKVQWLLSNHVDELGIALPFSDTLGHDSQESVEEAPHLPSFMSPSERLPGTSNSTVLMHVGTAEVMLQEGVQNVTEDNKKQYVECLERWRLYEGISWQMEAMAKGLSKVLPEELRQEMHNLLTPLEIAQLLSGLGTLNVEDWEAHTAYTHGLHKESPVVKWFWQVVHDWATTEESMLPQLLQFVTGSARVPVGGFSELVGFNGAKHFFTLAGANHLSANALPVAHTCICTLDMPPYSDFETCRQKMTQMLRLGRDHFDEGAGQAEG